MISEQECREYLVLLQEEVENAKRLCLPKRLPIRLRQLRDMIRSTEWILGIRTT